MVLRGGSSAHPGAARVTVSVKSGKGKEESRDAAYCGSGLLIGFAVADAEKEWQEKEKAGLCPGPMVTPNPHAKFFTVKDPNGVEIQFLQED